MSEYHILSHGLGVQTTTLDLMEREGLFGLKFDHKIFADTQEEPAPVYRHLEWLQDGRITVRTNGKLGDDLAKGQNCMGRRFASIPAFTRGEGDEREGRIRRQCSAEYKVQVIERFIRREVLGLKPRQRVPKGVRVHQYFGISLDEAGRSRRIAQRFSEETWCKPHFPLVDLFLTRADCLTFLGPRVPHQTPRSACVCCPYRSDAEWVWLREHDPAGWQRAVSLDHDMRRPGWAGNRQMHRPMYLHRSCKPLGEVIFDTRPKARDLQLSMSFAAVCEGVCGV